MMTQTEVTDIEVAVTAVLKKTPEVGMYLQTKIQLILQMMRKNTHTPHHAAFVGKFLKANRHHLYTKH